MDVLQYFNLSVGYRQSDRAALLRKTIHGLKQSARQWNINLSTKLFRAGLTWMMSNYSDIIRNFGPTKVIIVIVYVDDFLVFGPKMSEIGNIKSWLAIHSKIKDLGSCGQFLGTKVEQNEKLRTERVGSILWWRSCSILFFSMWREYIDNKKNRCRKNMQF